MPGRSILPKELSAHRVACKALYRALLEQCPRIPLPADLPPNGPINPLKHFVRKRFKENVHHSSLRIIGAAMNAGYAAQQLFHSSIKGNQTSTQQIHSFLQTTSSSTLSSRKSCLPPPPKPPRRRVWPYPNAPKLLDTLPRPKEQLKGNRIPPVMVVTGASPFIKIRGREQSPFLSRVLRDQIKQKQWRFNNVSRLEFEEDVGEAENEWEGWLEREGGMDEWAGSEEVDWTVQATVQRREILGRVAAQTGKFKMMGRRMVEIVEKEKDLWREERGTRRWEKKEEKREIGGEEKKMKDLEEFESLEAGKLKRRK